MKVLIITKVGCPYCENTKKLLNQKNIEFTDYPLNANDKMYNTRKQKIFKEYNWNTFPIIFINDQLIGGYSELLKII